MGEPLGAWPPAPTSRQVFWTPSLGCRTSVAVPCSADLRPLQQEPKGADGPFTVYEENSLLQNQVGLTGWLEPVEGGARPVAHALIPELREIPVHPALDHRRARR